MKINLYVHKDQANDWMENNIPGNVTKADLDAQR